MMKRMNRWFERETSVFKQQGGERGKDAGEGKEESTEP